LFGRGQMDLLFGSSSAHRHPPLYHRSYHTDGIYSTYLWDITLGIFEKYQVENPASDYSTAALRLNKTNDVVKKSLSLS